MKQVKIDLGLRPSILKLGEAERGRLFKAILDFSTTGEYDEPCGNEKYVWESLKESIASQRESFTHRSKVNATNRTNRKESLGIVTNRKESFDKEKESCKEKETARTKTTNTNNSNININNNNINNTNNTAEKQRLSEDFQWFWNVYPRKTDKKDALKAWNKISPSRDLVCQMIQSIESWKKTDQWSDQRYIPHPSTWLNQERWNDIAPEKQDKLSNLRQLNQMYREEAKRNDEGRNNAVVLDDSNGIPSGFGIF